MLYNLQLYNLIVQNRYLNISYYLKIFLNVARCLIVGNINIDDNVDIADINVDIVDIVDIVDFDYWSKLEQGSIENVTQLLN